MGPWRGTQNVCRVLKSSNDCIHPKGYLTKITTDYEAKHDEELSVQKGTMVKVSNCHHRGNGIQLSAV